MRTIKAFCLAALCAMSVASAQDPPLDAAVEAQHAPLRQLQATMEDALNKRDMDALLANVTEDVVFTTMNGDVARGREGIREYFKKMMEGPGKRVESVTTKFTPDALSIFYGDNVAVAFGASNDSYLLTNGSKFNIQGRWTATLVLQDSRWLVGAFHYSANVFDNPILKAQRKVLIIAGVLAALLFALLGYFVGRRRTPAAAA